MNAETVKAKGTRKYYGFITYSNTIYFDGIWFGNSGYLITQWETIMKEQSVSWFKNWGRTKNPQYW